MYIHGCICSISHELWKNMHIESHRYWVSTFWSDDVLVCRCFRLSAFRSVDVAVWQRKLITNPLFPWQRHVIPTINHLNLFVESWQCRITWHRLLMGSNSYRLLFPGDIESLIWNIHTEPLLRCVGLSNRGLVSISDKTSYHKISQSLEAATFVFRIVQRFQIWQAPRQQRCRCACHISKRYKQFDPRSRAFETWWDLTIRRLIRYWNRAQYITVHLKHWQCAISTNDNLGLHKLPVGTESYKNINLHLLTCTVNTSNLHRTKC